MAKPFCAREFSSMIAADEDVYFFICNAMQCGSMQSLRRGSTAFCRLEDRFVRFSEKFQVRPRLCQDFCAEEAFLSAVVVGG